jgi:hypothetical protein
MNSSECSRRFAGHLLLLLLVDSSLLLSPFRLPQPTRTGMKHQMRVKRKMKTRRLLKTKMSSQSQQQ